MERSKLEEYIGKRVEAKMFDNSILTGVLKEGNGFFKERGWYNITDEKTYKGLAFRCSHVKKMVIKDV